MQKKKLCPRCATKNASKRRKKLIFHTYFAIFGQIRFFLKQTDRQTHKGQSIGLTSKGGGSKNGSKHKRWLNIG